MTQPAWRETVSERNATAPMGGGGAPGTSEVIVATEALASAIPGLTDGQQVFIKSHRSWWRFNANSPAPLVAHVVIASASAGASPRLLRTAYAAPEWRESITDVYIDPANVTGIANDENQAIFSAPQAGNARQPLRTWQELSRRWGRRNTINTGDLVNLTFTVHVLSFEPGASAGQDPWDLDWVSFVDTYPRIVGEASAIVLGPVALTAFTAQNPSVPAPGGTAAQIQIGVTVWGPFVGKRIRRVSDGSIAYVIKALAGAGQARISNPALQNEASFFLNPTAVVWAAGDVVVVENLTDVNAGHTHFGFAGSALGFYGQVNLLDLNTMNVSGGDVPWDPNTEDYMTVCSYQSTSDRPVTGRSNIYFNNCGIRNSVAGSLGENTGAVFAGGAILPFLNGGGGIVSVVGPADMNVIAGPLDYHVYVQGGGVLFRGPISSAAFSVWDAAVSAIYNPGAHAVSVGGPANLNAMASQLALRSSNPVFGSGSAGKGARMASGSKISAYQTLPNVTGAAGDLQLADSVIGMWGDFATGTYQPPGGIALTWAAVAAPAGVAGFGGSAHNHDQDAHVNKASAT